MERKTIVDIIRREVAKRGEDSSAWRFKFYKRDPYQARRYKPEHVGWSVWVFKGTTLGYLITQEEYEGENFKSVIDSLVY